ncbi:MAG: hypothetical protein KJ757_00425 [Planctomycetes bacterium]|nr:hypothetical protein [Planctomycetota bacterium]MBU1517358.1 hypothetical protein [Planctomycetota bacterium]MBU2457683.1 hypothetical protein [Planctomycetota bacterium]MBU2596020.1 hypothetical protein [Planctomycetota bacterium]
MLNRLFDLQARNTSVKTEIMAGKAGEIKLTMWLITGLSILYFLIPLLVKGS